MSCVYVSTLQRDTLTKNSHVNAHKIPNKTPGSADFIGETRHTPCNSTAINPGALSPDRPAHCIRQRRCCTPQSWPSAVRTKRLRRGNFSPPAQNMPSPGLKRGEKKSIILLRERSPWKKKKTSKEYFVPLVEKNRFIPSERDP